MAVFGQGTLLPSESSRWVETVWRKQPVLICGIYGDQAQPHFLELAHTCTAGCSWWLPNLACLTSAFVHPTKRREPSAEIQFKIKIKEKLENILTKGFIGSGTVKSLANYFLVPKRESDVMMMYAALLLGLNDCLWDPSCALPNAEALTGHIHSILENNN